MGLFGRDDRSEGKPSPTETHHRQKNTPSSGSTTTLIARAAHIEGEIKGAGEVRIEGTVSGKLDCSATVMIDQGGKIEGEIKAETVTIAGRVEGNIFATQKIELTPTAQVDGDITSPRVLIREGATFEGQVYMTGKKTGKTPAPAKQDDKEPKSDKS